MQLALGAFVFHSEAGRELLWGLNQGVVSLLGYSMEGVRFLFGPLAVEPGRPQSPGFILAIQYLPTIIFFMAFMALLYHVGVMPFVVRLFSKAFVRLLGTSGAESVGTASTIFVGVESAGAVRPFLDGMTRSELLTLLTACMATVASSTMAIYVGALRGAFPQIAGHLVSASVLSAPAAVVISKIILPETEVPETLGTVPKTLVEGKPGLLEAIIAGAMDGVKQVAGISALLVAFLGLVALIDGILGEVGQWLHMDPQTLFPQVLSYVGFLAHDKAYGSPGGGYVGRGLSSGRARGAHGDSGLSSLGRVHQVRGDYGGTLSGYRFLCAVRIHSRGLGRRFRGRDRSVGSQSAPGPEPSGLRGPLGRRAGHGIHGMRRGDLLCRGVVGAGCRGSLTAQQGQGEGIDSRPAKRVGAIAPRRSDHKPGESKPAV